MWNSAKKSKYLNYWNLRITNAKRTESIFKVIITENFWNLKKNTAKYRNIKGDYSGPLHLLQGITVRLSKVRKRILKAARENQIYTKGS